MSVMLRAEDHGSVLKTICDATRRAAVRTIGLGLPWMAR